jgi:uncharacterized protein YjgD (DUF1641 family)
MAQPVPFQPAPRNPHEVLRARLERAPEEHAEAILAAYDVLQELHDRGVLDVVRSGLAASDELLGKVADAVDTPEAIRALRNLLFWQSILGSIEPKWFRGIFQAIPDGLATATAQRDQPVSLWRIIRRAISKDSLRGLAAGVDFLESFGRHLHALEASAQQQQPATAGDAHREAVVPRHGSGRP